MLFEVTVGMTDKVEKAETNVSSWSSMKVKFLVQGFEVAQETSPLENSLNKKCYHVGIRIIFHPFFLFSTGEVWAIE